MPGEKLVKSIGDFKAVVGFSKISVNKFALNFSVSIRTISKQFTKEK